MPEDKDLLELVRIVRQGSPSQREEAAGGLDGILRPKARGFFRRKGFAADDVDDLTQDALLRVFDGLETFQGDSAFSFHSWFSEILLNVYRNKLRARATGKRKGVTVSIDDQGGRPDDGEEKSPAREIASDSEDALQAVLREERLIKLRKAIAAFPPQLRRVCTLRYIQQRKYREIAEILEISIQTVKAHLHTAKKRF